MHFFKFFSTGLVHMHQILCFSDSIFSLDSGPGVAPVGVGDAGVVQPRDGGVQAATLLSRANLMCQHRSEFNILTEKVRKKWTKIQSLNNPLPGGLSVTKSKCKYHLEPSRLLP